MSVAARPVFAFDNSFVRELEGLYVPWTGASVERPALLALNAPLAAQLGVDLKQLQSPEGVAVLAGSVAPEGAEPVAQGYAGHQFGNFSPRLGDGRALLLGEVIDTRGVRQDLHLKGSGRTPFARGGDGKAAIGPMLREFAIAEAMHALGIRTARALAVVATNEPVARETMLPGAVLTRVAESHLRVGSFEYAAFTLRDVDLLRRLADHAIARHYPEAASAPDPYLAFYARVVEAQADLIASWMLVGFVHGVMNTDNMTISGQSIDFGPCAFMDRYDAATVFSSIDAGARYAYGNQPGIGQWDLARLGNALLPLIDPDDQDAAASAAEEILKGYAPRYHAAFGVGMTHKLGLRETTGEVDELVHDLMALLQDEQPDFTGFFRALAASLRGDRLTAHVLFTEPARLDAWVERWRGLLADQGVGPADAAAAMDRVNPLYIPRNHLVQAALDAATAGDLEPFSEMLTVLEQPFTERPGLEAWAAPAPGDDGPYRTFCGT